MIMICRDGVFLQMPAPFTTLQGSLLLPSFRIHVVVSNGIEIVASFLSSGLCINLLSATSLPFPC